MRIIVLENYTMAWQALYKKELSTINGVLSEELISAHHIGSTAIAGIKAKPVIDILLEVKSINAVDKYNSQFLSIGYEAKGEFGVKGRRFFQKGGNERTHHVHIFKKNDPEVRRHIKFRDYLVKNEEKAKEYENLKINLAEKYSSDSDSYSKGKDEFIRLVQKEIE